MIIIKKLLEARRISFRTLYYSYGRTVNNYWIADTKMDLKSYEAASIFFKSIFENEKATCKFYTKRPDFWKFRVLNDEGTFDVTWHSYNGIKEFGIDVIIWK